VPGGSFILDTDPTPVPLWGQDDQVWWSDGEGLIIAGAQGLGKTTLAQQVVLGRCGFSRYAQVLDFPIIPGERWVLYLAMDRPKQAARSFHRMVSEDLREDLNARLAVWPGPPKTGHLWVFDPGALQSVRKYAQPQAQRGLESRTFGGDHVQQHIEPKFLVCEAFLHSLEPILRGHRVYLLGLPLQQRI
jgi:AAA domain